MIISKKDNIKKDTIVLDNKIIEHSPSINILGTTLNDNLDFSTHIYNCENPLIKQLKNRLIAIKYANIL